MTLESAKLIVSKFGGSSMADFAAMQRSANIAHRQKSSIVLVSATFKTTDQLVALIANAQEGNWSESEKILFQIREKHFDIASDLDNNQLCMEHLKSLLNELETLARGIFLLKECSPRARDQVLSLGERMSSLIFAKAFENLYPQNDIVLFDIREVMITTDHHNQARPILELIAQKAAQYLEFKPKRIYISQGFIGKTVEGQTTTLGRGGSDYSAALIAEAVNADILEIWTDVAGIATTDPRVCSKARAIAEISYDEASEMAQYGAKILHPTTLVPAMRKNIPVFVGSSYEGDAKGTWIREKVEHRPMIRALAKRNDQALLTIRTPKMLNAIGFMKNIFQVFGEHEISIDCVTTSEISVAVSIDRATMDNKLLIRDLEKLGEVSFESGHSLISLIGNNILSTHGLARRLFNSLGDINVRMMCLGASAYNFNILVDEKDCDLAISRLHKEFIEEEQ